MGTHSRMTVNGQVTIPDDVRAALGLRPGDVVAFEHAGGAIRLVRGQEAAAPSFDERLERARALSAPLPLGMTTDEYMSWIRW